MGKKRGNGHRLVGPLSAEDGMGRATAPKGSPQGGQPQGRMDGKRHGKECPEGSSPRKEWMGNGARKGKGKERKHRMGDKKPKVGQNGRTP